MSKIAKKKAHMPPRIAYRARRWAGSVGSQRSPGRSGPEPPWPPCRSGPRSGPRPKPSEERPGWRGLQRPSDEPVPGDDGSAPSPSGPSEPSAPSGRRGCQGWSGLPSGGGANGLLSFVDWRSGICWTSSLCRRDRVAPGGVTGVGP